MRHKLECLDCRQARGWLTTTSQLYRPHTLGGDCWCLTPCELKCRMDKREWKQLEPVRYL